MDNIVIKQYLAPDSFKCSLCSSETFYVLEEFGREYKLCRNCLKEHLRLAIEERQQLLEKIDAFGIRCR